jgi:hypothetical protein
VGAALSHDKHIKGLWFTGSAATGRRIAAAAAPNMVRLNVRAPSPSPKEAQPLSQLDIQPIQHFDPSALWSDGGPEVPLKKKSNSSKKLKLSSKRLRAS